jgi:PAS domain S-box-containing protein
MPAGPATIPVPVAEAPASALRDVRPWVELALAAMRDGVVIFDERGGVAHVNPAAVAYGARAESTSLEHWPADHGIFLPDRTTPYPLGQLPVFRVLAGDSVVDEEVFIVNATVPDGVDLLVSGSPLRDPDGRVRGAVLVFRDVTERRRQARAIAVGEQQKKAILDNLPDIAWLKDVDGRFLAANRKLAESAGRSRPEDVLGVTDHDLWPKVLADGYRAADLEVMRTRRAVRIEERIVDASGRAFWVETVKAAVIGPGGEVIGTTGIARDITERRGAEVALRQLAGELEQRVNERTAALAEAQETLVRRERLAVLGQLAGGVAHQIRNPLAAIMNASYVVERHLAKDDIHPDVHQALRIIHDEVRHANVIITGLLDFARVRSLERQPVDIGELVTRALGAAAVPETIQVEREIRASRTVDVDVDQLQSALANVFRNAVEAMPDGGLLRVEVMADDREVIIRVGDTGPGLGAQILAHLFEPLHSTKPLGVGLGLVTARTFVEAHGGRIEAKTSDRGALFEVRLPSVTPDGG